MLLRGTNFVSQKEKMALMKNLARNDHALVTAGDSSGRGSDMATAVKIVKRKSTEKGCLEQSGHRRTERCI